MKNHSEERSGLIKRIWRNFFVRPVKNTAEGNNWQRGRVKWFNRSRGYGFIARDNGPDVFVHYSAIYGKGERTLKEGEIVEFEVIQNQKGFQAKKVKKV